MRTSSVSKLPHESNEHKTGYNNDSDPDNRTKHVLLIEETFRRLNSIVLVGSFTLEKEKIFFITRRVNWRDIESERGPFSFKLKYRKGCRSFSFR